MGKDHWLKAKVLIYLISKGRHPRNLMCLRNRFLRKEAPRLHGILQVEGIGVSSSPDKVREGENSLVKRVSHIALSPKAIPSRWT